MNGHAAPVLPEILATNPCIQLLENMLAEAKAGKLSSIAVIGITPQSAVATAYAGGQRGDMFVGTAILADALLAEIKGPQKRPTIIPARMGG